MNDILYNFSWERLKGYKKIALFGAGCVGKDYYYQLQQNKLKVVTWVDSNDWLIRNNPLVEDLDSGLERESDIWLLAIFRKETADEMRFILKSKGVEDSKIFWEKPIIQPIISKMEQDDFLTKLKEWKLKKWNEDKESIWELGKDINVLMQDYKRLLNTGHYDKKEWYLNREKKIAYLNNAKVACTSIIANIGCIGEVEHDFYEKSSSPMRFEGQEDRLNDYFKFTFVRNPFSRLVSCYKNKMIREYSNLSSTYDSLYFSRKRYLMGFLNEDFGFNEFVKKICQIPLEWQDRHFRSQYDLLYKEGVCLVGFVGRFEDLPHSYESIRKQFALPELCHYNCTKNTDWEKYYNEDIALLVYEKYKQDITFFGYQDEYEKLMNKIKEKRN